MKIPLTNDSCIEEMGLGIRSSLEERSAFPHLLCPSRLHPTYPCIEESWGVDLL